MQQQIVIVGAGICGLMAARQLVDAGHLVTVIDKAARVGGRLATRAIGPGLADSGAQFFTVRDPRFRQAVECWQEADLAYVWGTGWSDGSLGDSPNDGHPRYAIRGGMNALAAHLSAGLNGTDAATIITDRRIARIAVRDGGWLVADEAGEAHRADALILTPPVPQSLALLAAGEVSLAAADRDALAKVRYAPCLCGLFWLEGKIELPAPGAVQRPGTDISWIADNQAKGISPAATLVTVHAGPEYSERHYDAPDAELLATLQASLQPFTSGRIKTHAAALKRWRYSQPLELHPERFLRAADLPPLYFGGDGFCHPRLEGAALSGLNIGDDLVAALPAP